ncbi:MAG: hypothetical protein CMN97_01040 [Synechococcus sp. NAT40]|jgi:hypothetical protein|nr:hypothetical protein [Synechococcus sp. NAT40]|tara:strand:+ start:241 stop:435 length:195 start_codon:yes stop_codon:yes gene_type:complete
MNGSLVIVEMLRWPLAFVIGCIAISRAIVAISRAGIKVEITTKRPILISTGVRPLQAAVEKVRI